MKNKLVVCKRGANCPGKNHCEHADRHDPKIYRRNDFLTESCIDEYECPIQNIFVKCERKRHEKKQM